MVVDNEIKQSEGRIQQEAVIWYNNAFCLATCRPRCLVFAVPNAYAQSQVGVGVLKGVADVMIIHRTVDNAECRVLFVEVKTPEGRQSPAQQEFERRIKEMGPPFEYHVIRSVENLKEIIGNGN